MAVYRSIYTTFWSDSKINDEFSPEDKYFYLYLLTNPFTNICGCYEISIKRMASDLGYDSDTVRKLIKRMSEEHKVISYNESTKEILIINWYRYNWNKSPKLVSGIKEFFPKIKCIEFKKYIADILKSENLIEENDLEDMVSIPYEYPMDTVCIPTVTVSNTNTDTVNNNIINNNVSNVECTLELQEELEEDEKPVDDDIKSVLKTRRTIPPRIEDVAAYCALRQNGIDPEEFWNFYNGKGWKVGKDSMKDWQSAMITWEKRNGKKKPKKTYSPGETPWEAANWLSEKLHRMHPTIQPVNPDVLQIWASVFDRMETEDRHPPQEILDLMRYAFQDNFWYKNIASPWDLRRNYVKLLAQAEKDGWFN